jgi:hypothetical protein
MVVCFQDVNDGNNVFIVPSSVEAMMGVRHRGKEATLLIFSERDGELRETEVKGAVDEVSLRLTSKT